MKLSRPLAKQTIPEEADKVFDGVVFDVYQWEQKLFDGTQARFEVLKRQDTVNIIPVTPEGEIILTRQEQPGQKPFIGTPGGRIDKNENVLKAAKRELLEETGYVSDTWELWDSMQPSAMIDWAIYTFIAKNCRKVQDVSPDAGERITLRFVTFYEFMQVICDDTFRDSEITLKLLKAKEKGTLEETKKLFLTHRK